MVPSLQYLETHSQYIVGTLLEEAAAARLARQVPRHSGGLRLRMALVLYRVADWLDDGVAASRALARHRSLALR